MNGRRQLHSLFYSTDSSRLECRRSYICLRLRFSSTDFVLGACGFTGTTGGRYHLAFFVLLAPAIATVVGAIPWKPAAGVVASVLLLTSIPWLLGNHSRPLVSGWPGADVDSVLVVPREELIFANAPYLTQPYQDMVELMQASGCGTVAVVLPGSGLEYPLWSLLEAPRQDLRIEWLVAGTASARYTEAGFNPCAVVCEKCPAEWERVRGLPEVYRYGSFRLFLDRLPE
jgi:hypothetical protein